MEEIAVNNKTLLNIQIKNISFLYVKKKRKRVLVSFEFPHVYKRDNSMLQKYQMNQYILVT